MNNVSIVGRITEVPKCRYTSSQMAVTEFSVAIDRPNDKNGNKTGTDFPRVTVWGKQAENCEKYLVKGQVVEVTGKLRTDTYEDNTGHKVFKTTIVANYVEFGAKPQGHAQPQQESMPENFEDIDADVPF